MKEVCVSQVVISVAPHDAALGAQQRRRRRLSGTLPAAPAIQKLDTVLESALAQDSAEVESPVGVCSRKLEFAPYTGRDWAIKVSGLRLNESVGICIKEIHLKHPR